MFILWFWNQVAIRPLRRLIILHRRVWSQVWWQSIKMSTRYLKFSFFSILDKIMFATLYPVGGGFFRPPWLSLLFHRILHTGSAFENIKGQREWRNIPSGELFYRTFVFPLYAVLQHHATCYLLHHQAVHKTFHNLLLLNSIFDMVRSFISNVCCICIVNVFVFAIRKRHCICRLICNSIFKYMNLYFQVYLATSVPLFSLPQLFSSPVLQSTLTFLLPTALPIAHIGMVILFDVCICI